MIRAKADLIFKFIASLNVFWLALIPELVIDSNSLQQALVVGAAGAFWAGIGLCAVYDIFHFFRELHIAKRWREKYYLVEEQDDSWNRMFAQHRAKNERAIDELHEKLAKENKEQ